MKATSRRSFIRNAAIATGVIPVMNFPLKSLAAGGTDEPLSVHIFSKHLQFLDYRSVGEVAAELGFSGVDLTVRQDGHVLPERVKTDLPLAVEEIGKGGSRCELITTDVESAHKPLDLDVIHTAALAGIKYYRSNWFKYPDDQTLTEALKNYQKQVEELSYLNRKLGLIGCYQNHAGKDVGASFWEVKMLLDKADKQHFGSQYDIRHAVVEGGRSWETGLRLLHPHIKTIVIKDFKWGITGGRWDAINTPVGEGMVDFPTYFKLLKKYRLKPPVTLHVEYPVGGAEHGHRSITVDKDFVFRAMKRDLKTLQDLWLTS